jgi:Eukaryotic aspartyl protease
LCILQIYGNIHHKNEYILGDVFMQSLYVVLDYENSQFAVNGNYIDVEPLDKSKKDTGGSSMVWIIIGSVIGVLVLVAIIGCFIVK